VIKSRLRIWFGFNKVHRYVRSLYVHVPIFSSLIDYLEYFSHVNTSPIIFLTSKRQMALDCTVQSKSREGTNWKIIYQWSRVRCWSIIRVLIKNWAFVLIVTFTTFGADFINVLAKTLLLGPVCIKALCKMLVKSTPGVNLIDILHAPFVPKSHKAKLYLEKSCAKHFRKKKFENKMLVKLTPGRQSHCN